ncbi:hypothetical protein HYS54_02210 [Candidatus Micrarchaeota archaeon]|nr:hypothetical protein [Candidatus Micrarchaeota archaeon]
MIPGFAIKPRGGQPSEKSYHLPPTGVGTYGHFPGFFTTSGAIFDGDMSILKLSSEGVVKFVFGIAAALAAFWYLPHSLPSILLPAVIAFWAGMGLAKAKMFWFIYRYLERPTKILVPGIPDPKD